MGRDGAGAAAALRLTALLACMGGAVCAWAAEAPPLALPPMKLLAEPLHHATSLALTAIGLNTMKVSWVRGDGERVIVVGRAASNPIDPADGQEYLADAVFGQGQSTGTGSFVVYAGPADSVTVTGLTPDVRYYFQAFEFAGTGAGCNYLTAGSPEVAARTTALEPSVAGGVVRARRVAGHRAAVAWPKGDGTRRLVVVRRGAAVDWTPEDRSNYIARAQFTTSPVVADDKHIVYAGAAGSVDLQGLTPGKVYHCAVYEYNGIGEGAANYKIDAFATGTFTTRHTVVSWDFPNGIDDPTADYGSDRNLVRTLVTQGGTGSIDCGVEGATTSSARADQWNGGTGVKAWAVGLSTRGYANITLCSRLRSSPTGPRDFLVEYRLNGGAWQAVSGGGVVSGNDEWLTGLVEDLRLPPECAGQDLLEMRWLMSSDTRADGGSAVGETGASNIDDIMVVGDIVERATMIMF